MPESLSDPHTLGFAPDGSLWFTAQWANAIGRFYPETREVDTLTVPQREARPYGLVVGADGRPWIALFGTASLATVDPQGMQLETVALPRDEARPRRLAIDDKGAVWYTDYAAGRLGRLDPADRSVEEWSVPGGPDSAPYAMALDGRGRVWFVETGSQPCRLVGFDPRDEAFFAIEPIPSGAGSVRHMIYDRQTQALWFGTDANTLARVIVE
jgi:virginiamycin B lyase